MANTEDFEIVDDIVNMPELQEHHIIKNLRARYAKEKIYTNVGTILIAINPYKVINIYGLDMVTKYHKKSASLPPHLFAQGNAAYLQMKDEQEDQVVVISGESGSGKTESTKLLMHFLAKISNKTRQSDVTEQVLEANPILESFGNAKTIINDNSSRFGKYVQLYFSSGVLVGSKTNKYLLERSRIVKQLPGERNYHFFYEMFRGLTSNQKSELHLSKVEDFAYLNYGRDASIDSRNDLVNFQNVQRAFEHHKFTNEEVNGIFRILAAVLHLGNITFNLTENKHGMDGVSLGDESHCKIVGELLKVPFEGLKRVLTTRIAEARNEKMVIPHTKEQAIDVRDSISKSLYQHVFRWLVHKVNLNSKCEQNLRDVNSIAILDIFGFEDLSFNSFEQLCINYANESLQYYFTKHIFKIEQEEYAKEGVTWHVIDFNDNQSVVDLISKRPKGIFQLLDEESYFPNGSDRSFLEKCHASHGKSEFYIKPRMADLEFSIKHYAGVVTYNVENFLDKNRESLKSEVLLFLLESEDDFVSGFFEKDLGLKDKAKLSKTNSRSTIGCKNGTVSSLFHESLQSLLEMMRCNPWFIRCIKPNNTKSAMLFQDELVLNQLRATGMMETVKIRKLGYCIRQKFLAFYQKFRSLLPHSTSGPLKITEANLQILCRSILENQPQVWLDSWEIGKTKVFMKEDLLSHLVSMKNKVMAKAVLIFQKYGRGRLARDLYERMKKGVLTLQSATRGWMIRKRYNKRRDDVITIQAHVRRVISQKRYRQMKEDCIDKMNENNELMQKLKDEMKARRSKIFEEIKSEGPLPDEVVREKISFKVNANSLDIPVELAYQIAQHPGIDDVFVKVSKVASFGRPPQLPFDINSFEFKKYAEVYCNGRLSCIPKSFYENPILPKNSVADLKSNLELSKLLLRFLIIENDSVVKQMLSVDFLVSKCLKNEVFKDELLLQACSKTFVERKSSVQDRAWFLITLCAGCFHPSQVLSNYLLNYASHYCPQSLAPHCQRNLLRGMNAHEMDRCHPPAKLEWVSNHRRLPMALQASFYDGTKILSEVDAWMSAEEFAEELLQERNLDDRGWSIELVEENVSCFLSGNDFMMDGLKELETEEKFLSTSSHFLAYKAGINRSSSNLEKLLAYKPIDMTGTTELKEFVSAPARSAINFEMIFKFNKRRDTIYANNAQPQTFFADFGLSERSPLNERFMKCLENCDQHFPTPSNSLLDLTVVRPNCLTRTLVSTIEEDESLNNKSSQMVLQNGGAGNDTRPDVSMWVENGIAPALIDDKGGHYMNAKEISGMLKGGGEEDKKAPSIYRPDFGSTPASNPPLGHFIRQNPLAPPSETHLKRNNQASPRSPIPRPIMATKLSQNHMNNNIKYENIREDDIEDDREHFDLNTLQYSDTKLHPMNSQFHLTYGKVRWNLRARKEIFTRNEDMNNELVNELIYLQIISDLDKRCIRISQDDENELKSKMGCRDLDFITKKNHNKKEKSQIIEVAKQWPNYFSRIYQISGGSRLQSVQYLAISHTGVRLLTRTNKDGREQFQVFEDISYEEIIDICLPQPRTLQIHYKPDQHVLLYFKQASKARNLIEAFCIEVEKNSVFVKAIQNYPTNENMLLSFAKGDIIKLTDKNQELEKGWLFGAVHGKVGMFPEEYVVSLARHQLPLKFNIFEVNTTLPDFSLYNTMKEIRYSSFDEAKEHYVMLEYASKYFRKNVSMSFKVKQDLAKVHQVWAGQEFLEKIKWTKSPIKDSLTCISSDNLNKIATAIFKCIMEYMHDYPLTKGTSSHNSVTTIFNYCHNHPELINETYCQIIKQLTSNKSPKSGSPKLGWKLLMMFTSFFNSDDTLRPYLFKYMEDVARNQAEPDSKLAEKCVHNLKQTIKYGGRKEKLDKAEISNITIGGYTRQVVCTVPGNLMTRIFVDTSMVVKDAVEQICQGYGINDTLECSEYIIYIIHGNEKSYFPLNDATYVMDIVSDFSQKERPCQFVFCRFTWVSPLPNHITSSHLRLLFAQSKPDYLDGLLMKPPPKGSSRVKDTVINLSFYLMKSDNFVDFQNKKGVQRYLPKNMIGQFSTQELQTKFQQCHQKYVEMSPDLAQRCFMETLYAQPLFGSTFFVLNYVSSHKINSKCLLGVNTHGLSFLSEKTMDLLWKLPLHQVLGVEVRKGRKREYVELKHGSLFVQNMSQLHLDNPHPLCLLIEKYMKVYGSFRNSSSNTGSSSSSEMTKTQSSNTFTSSPSNSSGSKNSF